MFVYCVTNSVNDKVYIGKWSGKRVRDRWSLHLSEVRRGSHTAFHNAIRKHGPGVFDITVLATATTIEDVSNLEKLWIWALQATNRVLGYNISLGGDGASYKRSPETKKRMSTAVKKRLATVIGYATALRSCRAASLANTGRVVSKETRAKLSAANVLRAGEKRSAVACANMRVAHAKRLGVH